MKRYGSMARLTRTLPYVKPYWTFIAVALFVMLADSLFHIYFARLQERLIDAMNVAASGEVLTLVYVSFALIIVVSSLKFVGGYTDSYYRTLVTKDVSLDVFRRLTRLPFSVLQKHKASDFVARATGDAGSTANLVGGFMHQLLANAMLLMFAFFYLLYMNAALAVAALCTGPLLFLIGRFFDRRVRDVSARVQKLSAELRGIIQETVRGMSAIRSYRAESFFRERFERKKVEWNRQVVRLRMTQTYMTLTVELVMNVVVIACTFYICLLVISGNSSLGAIIAFIFLMVKVQIPFIEFSGAWNSMQEGLAAADRVYQVLDVPEVHHALSAVSSMEISAAEEKPGAEESREDEERERMGKGRWDVSEGQPPAVAVEWRGVSCDDVQLEWGTKPAWVRTEKRILRDIHLVAERGERLAITGPSGAGKTTLLRTCCGLIGSDRGLCLVEGRPVDGTNAHLSQSIAYVPQNPYLFPDMTVRENIAFGMGDVSEEDVVECAKIAQAHEFITSLERQYDTKIGDLEAGISGGERQRIAIARALIRRTPVLALDEATASLDRATRQTLIETLSAELRRRGATLLIVSHQLEIVQNMDRIVFMKDGKIERVGTHEELMQTCADYRQMIESVDSPAS